MDAVHELVATLSALNKLGRRGISAKEAGQLRRNRHVTAANRRAGRNPAGRLLLVGQTDGGRALTLVIERTDEPTTWLVITGWDTTEVERKMLER